MASSESASRLPILNNTYIPVGHGNDTGGMFPLPQGCHLIVIELSSGDHAWSNEEEIDEYVTLARNIKRSHIFTDPTKNAAEIIDILGPVAIYSPGQQAPDLFYRLELDWKNQDGSIRDIRYSGIIPLDVFMSKSFSTKNVRDKMPVTTKYIRNAESLHTWIRKMKELYKFSIYPTSDTFSRFETVDGVNDIFKEFRKRRRATELFPDSEKNGVQDAIELFKGLPEPLGMGEYGYVSQSLQNLMNKFPGTYIHMVCRTLIRTSPRLQRKIDREMSLNRVPFMSEKQLDQFLASTTEYKRSSIDFTHTLHNHVHHQKMLRDRKKRLMGELSGKVRRIEGGKNRKTRKH